MLASSEPKYITLVAAASKHDHKDDPMCQDFDALEVHRRSYIGWRLDSDQGEKFFDRELGMEMRHAVFVALEGEAALVRKPWPCKHWREYRDELQAGTLLPGDQFTAQMAGVPFDPSFKGAAAKSVGMSPKPAKGGA